MKLFETILYKHSRIDIPYSKLSVFFSNGGFTLHSFFSVHLQVMEKYTWIYGFCAKGYIEYADGDNIADKMYHQYIVNKQLRFIGELVG